MKEEKKKIKLSQVHEAEEEYARYIEELAHIITEEMQEQRTESLEPFELYAERIKARLFADPNQFRTKFIQGYRLLLEELSTYKLP